MTLAIRGHSDRWVRGNRIRSKGYSTMSHSPDDLNPFAPPLQEGRTSAARQSGPYPTFARVMFIISLVFAVLRLLTLPMSFLGYQVLEEQGSPMVVTVPWEIAMGGGIALFGLLGNSLMLARQKFGMYLGWLLVAAVVGSICVGFWQAGFSLEQFPAGSPQRTGAMIGMAITVVIRIALLGAYIYALLLFSSWMGRQLRVGAI